MKPRKDKQAAALELASRYQGTVTSLRAVGGGELAPAARAELLARAVAREDVEVEMLLLSYEQETGKPNRNHVRFRDGAMLSLGRSGRGNPFLRDHNQWDVTARGGTITESDTIKRGDGSYQIDQVAVLREPAAVERALRGLITSVSIGWRATGPVLCTACGTQVWTDCYHYPGQRLTEQVDDQGRRKLVSKRDGDIVVEWEFTAAELVETSEVNVPGVPGAGVTGIRAALAALADGEEPFFNGDEESQETKMSQKLLAAILPLLGLAATAGDDEAIAAVKTQSQELERSRARCGVLESEHARLAAEVETYRQAEAKHAADEFIATALAEGRIAPFDEPAWRRLFAAGADEARADMARRPKGCATPVGVPRQSATPASTPAPSSLTERQREFIAQMGMTEDQYRAGLAAAAAASGGAA